MIAGRSADWIIFDEFAEINKEVFVASFSSKVTDLLKSNTSTIESAVIGEGKLADMEAFVEVMEELLVPIMKHDRFWATTGPVKLSAYDDKKNKWKMVSCLGGEKLEYKGMRVGNRDGLLLTAITGNLLESENVCNVAAIIFTDGIRPHDKILNLIRRSKIPAMLVDEDSFSVATRINNTIFKLRAEEVEKT